MASTWCTSYPFTSHKIKQVKWLSSTPMDWRDVLPLMRLGKERENLFTRIYYNITKWERQPHIMCLLMRSVKNYATCLCNILSKSLYQTMNLQEIKGQRKICEQYHKEAIDKSRMWKALQSNEFFWSTNKFLKYKIGEATYN